MNSHNHCGFGLMHCFRNLEIVGWPFFGLRGVFSLLVVMGVAVASADDRTRLSLSASLASQFRGAIVDVSVVTPAGESQPDDLDLAAMAKASLNYLRGNPDPKRDYECKFSLGPLGIPCHVPLLAPNEHAYDPVSLADTDCRMDWQYAHMREMAGISTPDAVEQGVRNRILSYAKPDHLVWVHPAAWVGPEPKVEGRWVSTWSTANLIISLAETYQRTQDRSTADEARAMVRALGKLASWDGNRAYFPGGPVPWKDGQWLRLGWAATHAKNYPFTVEPFLRYYECTGDKEGLELAKAFAEGFYAGSQPGQGNQRVNPSTGAFEAHVHLHTRAIWGMAHLGAVLNESRYLDWAGKAYDFVLANGTDFGWYPEFIPQGEYRTEICVVGDMTSAAVWLARSGRPWYWDHVDRTVRNELRRSQFFLTPEFLAMFRQIHKAQSKDVIERAIAELRKLEGGFVAQAGFDDWVSYPQSLGKPGMNENGIQMMGCCPPEGMRALWEAWNAVVEEHDGVIRVNLAMSRDHAAAKVTAYRQQDGRLDVEPSRPGIYQLRPPAWADRGNVRLLRGREPQTIVWGGPGEAYVICRDVRAGEKLSLSWSVPKFSQRFVPKSVPGRTATVTVRWLGNQVLGVEPPGRYLRMFGQDRQTRD